MIGVEMYHNIKVLRKTNSVRVTAALTQLAPGTVQKYSQMDLSEANGFLLEPKRDRKSQFDGVLPFIEELLKLHPQMSAEVLHRKIKEKYPEITTKVRALRNYVNPLRAKYKDERIRYFHFVKTSAEDSQVQVDIGEIKITWSGTNFSIKLYFVVFVFSHSRDMFIYYHDKPFKTDDFIRAHLAAFRYFGGIAREYVYDQTKLVVINEKYREVLFNERFHQFALKNQFTPVVCEGYDPQSKGKVERSIGYVKSSFLTCEEFNDLEDLRRKSLDWLNKVANCRIHGTTGRRPDEMFEEEKPYLRPYFQHQQVENHVCVEKRGLISYHSNKYSVPQSYQRKKVAINAQEGRLYCYDIVTGQQIAEHLISLGRYQTIIDESHYDSKESKLERLTEKVMSAFALASADITFVSSLIQRIKDDNPNIAHGQLRGLMKLARSYPSISWQEAEKEIFALPKIKISVLTRLLDIVHNNVDLYDLCDVIEDAPVQSSSLDRPLEVYMKKIKKQGELNA